MTAQTRATPQVHSKFEKHVQTLVWKAYLQRQRRWRLLVLEAGFATIVLLISIFIGKPVFLTPLQAMPAPPLVADDIIASLSDDNIVGYAPDIPPYTNVMATVSIRLGITILSGSLEEDLNAKLYNMSRGTLIRRPVIWVIWKPKVNKTWEFIIRSTERANAREASTSTAELKDSNPHLRSGFLAVQLAVSEAILSYVRWTKLNYELSLVSMPVSPLMQQALVHRAIASIMLCFIVALLPPVLEVQALVVTETMNGFKKSLRIRGVAYSSIYIGWFSYAYMTSLPICVLASITLIQMFRWVHLLYCMIIILAYITVTIMLAMLMALFHKRAWIACTWTTLFTLMQLIVAQQIIHHQLDVKHAVLTFLLHLIIPPLGLEHAFNEFALLQTGKTELLEVNSLVYIIVLWLVMIVMYFCLLMLLQRTVKGVAIGGQVHWRTIIFKKIEEPEELFYVEVPSGNEREKLQEVDELLAKAISMRNVSKSIMGEPLLNNVTLDIYRGELTILYTKRYQSSMLHTLEDLLSGLTYPDSGTIHVLGEELKDGVNFMSTPYMTGYCHNCSFLVEDLTVKEHITLYCSICLSNESRTYTSEYCNIRSTRLLIDCDLKEVQHEYIRDLDMYFRAQLCWAIALLLEPRVVILPSNTQNSIFKAVIKDKIMEYRGYITIIKISYTSISFEYADRVFIFDSRLLVFGGTPAYMFFKYGREYRLRITLSLDDTNEDAIKELLEEASKASATVRAHLGSLLILRVPTMPTSTVAAFVKYLTDNMSKFGMESMTVNVPDSEEVCNRVILESRSAVHSTEMDHDLSKIALQNLAEPVRVDTEWRRSQTCCSTFRNLNCITQKFLAFHASNKFYCVVTVIAALVAGIFIGLSFAKVLAALEMNESAQKILHGELLTVEALEQKTTLVLRLDNSSEATSIANAYVLSETGATAKEIENVHYTALSYSESLTEYLVTRAIYSPQNYVYMFAYGIDVAVRNGKIHLQVLYSPMHHDAGAAARSLARAYLALIRHVTGSLDASLRVRDVPLVLDLSVWLNQDSSTAPLLVQFLLILTISHMTLLPSMESGFIRHTQCHAKNSSPACYWFSLFLCDFLLYCLLVFLMTASMVVMMVLVAPSTFHYMDLAILPILLLVYGAACIPQAYLFSLGANVALNTMIFMMINIVFSETTVIAKLLYGKAVNYLLLFLSLSPQFNMGYALVKLKKIFLYNSECIVFDRKNLCSSKMLHKCCSTCGVLDDCFSKRYYLTKDGVLPDIIAMACTAVIFMMLLLLVEHNYIQIWWKYISSKWLVTKETSSELENPGAARERADVSHKNNELNHKKNILFYTYGNYLLAYNITEVKSHQISIRDVCLAVGRGEALAISGTKVHGRERLCHILTGYKLPNRGNLWCKSRWRADRNFHKYAQQISFSGDQDLMPLWMTVYRGLELVAVLRGVPRSHLNTEIMNHIDALELHTYVNTVIKEVPPICRKRLNFAAAVIGAPPIVILDECTGYQKYSVQRAMYSILYNLRQRGHAIIICSASVESHMPVSSKLAILLEGRIYDIDQVDNLRLRFSTQGFTVVVHLKDEVDVQDMFRKHFENFNVNDTSEVLVNVQVTDVELDLATLFEKMEKLQSENPQVYSYIISAIPIDYIYNDILQNQIRGFVLKERRCFLQKFLMPQKRMILPSAETLSHLRTFEKQYSITKLTHLPWSVIFQR